MQTRTPLLLADQDGEHLHYDGGLLTSRQPVSRPTARCSCSRSGCRAARRHRSTCTPTRTRPSSSLTDRSACTSTAGKTMSSRLGRSPSFRAEPRTPSPSSPSGPTSWSSSRRPAPSARSLPSRGHPRSRSERHAAAARPGPIRSRRHDRRPSGPWPAAIRGTEKGESARACAVGEGGRPKPGSRPVSLGTRMERPSGRARWRSALTSCGPSPIMLTIDAPRAALCWLAYWQRPTAPGGGGFRSAQRSVPARCPTAPPPPRYTTGTHPPAPPCAPRPSHRPPLWPWPAFKKSDQLDVELHRPADLPAFILVKWPSAPSVAGPDTFGNLVTAVFRVLADAPRHLEPDAG